MSTANRGRKRQAPTESSSYSETNDNLSADDGVSVPGTATYDETFSQISGGRRRRRKFSLQRRDEVAKVRKIGACVECRARKVRCFHALQGTDAHPAPAPAPAPKLSLQQLHYGFETSFPEIKIYPGPIGESDEVQWSQSDEAQLQDPSFNEGADLIASVPASTARQERLALDLDDIDNIIEDNPKGSVVKSVTDIPEWGKNSQWVINATTLSNNQQYSGPSTTAYSYSNPNFSTEAGQASSTPASSNADLLSRNTEGGGHFRCNVQGCDDRRVFTEEIHLRRHQEIKHADLFQPKITYACGAIECRTRRYATIERLQSHINCTHPETLESPAQLPASEISWRDTQPDRRAQVNNFIAGQYLAGMEENPSTIPRQKARGEARPLAIDNRIQGKGSRRSQQQMVHRKTSMRGSVSTMQRQLSARSADDSAGKPLGPLNTASSNHRIGSTVINSNAFFQNPALQARLTVDQMDDFNVQHGVLQSYPHRTNSPTPSLIDRFGHNMQISNQSNLPQTCSEIGEETMDPAVLRERHGMYVTNTAPLPTSAAFVVNLDPEKQPMMPFNPRSINPYVNLEHTETGVIFQPGYNGTGMEVPAWSGQGSSSPAGQINFLNGTYAPLGFQFNNQNNHYPVNDSSSPNFPVTPSTTKQPMLMLNDGTMLNTSHGANFNYAPNTRKIDPVLSQQESLPRLEYSTMSSSGASESIISPVDDPNPYSNNFGDDLDLASCFFNEFNNVDMNTNDETM